MPKKSLEAIEEHFSQVTDPQVDWAKEHKLIDYDCDSYLRGNLRSGRLDRY